MAKHATALKDRLANDDMEWVRKKYADYQLRPDYRVLSALTDKEFVLEHTGGGTYVWQRAVGPLTVSIQGAKSHAPPVKMSEAVVVEVDDGRGHSVSIAHPSLSGVLDLLWVVG